MKSKKYIKIKTDMYDDTKFKIIDTMPERDTINYIWTRVLALSGKINDINGYLYVTKNMPYTVDILALEFNRSKEQVENALSVFIELNMMCKTSDGVFKICNWSKHQSSGRKIKLDDIIDINEKTQDLKNEQEDQSGSKLKTDKKLNSEELKSNSDTDKIININNSLQQCDNNNIIDKTNILDISNKDFVKNKDEVSESIMSNKKGKIQERKKRKKVKKNNINIEGETEEDIVKFKDPSPMPDDCRRIALFNY